MALTPTVVISGAITRTSSRTIKSKKDDKEYTFRSALIIGDDCLADVRFPDEMAIPPVGTIVRLRAAVGSYAGLADFTAEAFLSDAPSSSK